MKTKVHTFELDLDWRLVALISKIDRFDAEWASIERREGASLKELKAMATVSSVGASTRIEGSKMSDAEVDVLIQQMDITKLEDRDSQEVAGYFEVLDLISESYFNIPIMESSLKSLHKNMLKYAEKDEWHRGDYKQQSNVVEATMADGTRQVVFAPPDPGFPTDDAMSALVLWYQNDSETHALVKCAIFVYDMLSIHPFQDGNGRVSRLITTLQLLKHSYQWIEYVSFEHEIESRKNEYYQVLRACQAQRPGEDVTPWVDFFLSCLLDLKDKLIKKLRTHGIESGLSRRNRSILLFIGEHPGSRSGDIASRLHIPSPTVKRILKDLVDKGLIDRQGTGPGTNYARV